MELIKQDDFFVFKCSYENKNIPKKAGFIWSGKFRVWYTRDPDVAARVAEYASVDLKAELGALLTDEKEAIEASKLENLNIDIPCPEGLDYLGYQKAGIAYAAERDAVLIADEMGLGKTIQAIGISNLDPEIKKILIICPASLKLNWFREFRKWDVKGLSVAVADSQYYPKADVVIINYDILKKFSARIHSTSYDLLICDESHYLKNNKAQRTREVIGNKKIGLAPINAKKRVFLTGTPILNKPIEAWTACHFLSPDKFPSWKTYVYRYCAAHMNRFGFDVSGASNLGELQRKLRSSIMVRRLKADVLSELPDKIRQIIEVNDIKAANLVNEELAQWRKNEAKIEKLKQEAKEAKEHSEDAYRGAVEKLKEGARVAFGEMQRIRKLVAMAKVPSVVAHVKDCIETGGKVVIFAHHHDVVDALSEAFKKISVKLTGRTPTQTRQGIVDAFQENDKIKVFIGNIRAAGVGITLTASSHVIFAELDWTPGNMTQAEDRCHRIGQKDSVLVQHIVLDASLDAIMARKLVKKQANIDKALDIEMPELIF